MTRKWVSRIISLVGLYAVLLFLNKGSDKAFDNFGDTPILWWGMFALIALLALFQVGTTLSILSNVGGAKNRRPQDISAENRQPTPNAARLIAELNTMGFTRLGETLTKIPLMGKGVTWLLVSADKTDTAEVIDIGRGMPAMVQFSTVFMDEAVLETSYPIGENQDSALHRARYNTESLASAYQQHLTERAAMQTEHGSPRPISNMPQYQEWDIRYRELHVRKRLGRPVLPSILLSVWFVVLLGLFAFMGIASENPDQFSDETMFTVIAIGIGFLTIGGLIVLALNAKDMKIGKDISAAKAKESQPFQPAQPTPPPQFPPLP